jgi:hypothetical protein
LFSNSSVLLDDLFADIYIPFDCEFLVAREDPKGSVSLFEVYRVNRTAPLQSHLLAVGSQQSSLSWDNRSIYKRRKDLFGATIRATTSQVTVNLTIIIIIVVVVVVIILSTEGLAVVACSLTLKVQFVLQSVPRSFCVSSAFMFIPQFSCSYLFPVIVAATFVGTVVFPEHCSTHPLCP